MGWLQSFNQCKLNMRTSYQINLNYLFSVAVVADKNAVDLYQLILRRIDSSRQIVAATTIGVEALHQSFVSFDDILF